MAIAAMTPCRRCVLMRLSKQGTWNLIMPQNRVSSQYSRHANSIAMQYGSLISHAATSQQLNFQTNMFGYDACYDKHKVGLACRLRTHNVLTNPFSCTHLPAGTPTHERRLQLKRTTRRASCHASLKGADAHRRSAAGTLVIMFYIVVSERSVSLCGC